MVNMTWLWSAASSYPEGSDLSSFVGCADDVVAALNISCATFRPNVKLIINLLADKTPKNVFITNQLTILFSIVPECGIPTATLDLTEGFEHVELLTGILVSQQTAQRRRTVNVGLQWSRVQYGLLFLFKNLLSPYVWLTSSNVLKSSRSKAFLLANLCSSTSSILKCTRQVRQWGLVAVTVSEAVCKWTGVKKNWGGIAGWHLRWCCSAETPTDSHHVLKALLCWCSSIKAMGAGEGGSCHVA